MYLQSDGSYDILSSSDATSFIDLTDTKGKAWSGNPIGVNSTATGYELILETVGKKGMSYSEISVTSDGQVAKKGSTLTSLQLIGEEVTYGADLNQDGEIGLLPTGNRVDYGSEVTLNTGKDILVANYQETPHSFVTELMTEGYWYAGEYNQPTLASYLVNNGIVVDISADGDSDLIVPVVVGYRSGLDTRSNFIVLENSNGSLAYNAEMTEETPFISGSGSDDLIYIEHLDTDAVVTVNINTAVEGDSNREIPWNTGDIAILSLDPFENITNEVIPKATLPWFEETGRDTAVNAHSLAVGDVNGDGLDDIVVGDLTKGVFVLEQNLLGAFDYNVPDFASSLTTKGVWNEPTLASSDGGILLELHMDDFDGDGSDDLVIGWGHGSALSRLFFNDGLGNFSLENSDVLPASIYGVDNDLHLRTMSDDFDRDGDTDLIVLRVRYEPYYGGNYLQFLENDGSGQFSDSTIMRFGDPSSLVGTYGERLNWNGIWELIDINSDGANDIVGYLNTPNHKIAGVPLVWMNNGEGYFTKIDIPSVKDGEDDWFVPGFPIAWADFDADGLLEYVNLQSSWTDTSGQKAIYNFNTYELNQNILGVSDGIPVTSATETTNTINTTPSIYEITGVGHGILADGETYLTPLTDVKGNAWSGNPIAVNATFSGHDLILETLGKKGTSYSEISVSSDGQVAKKGSTLTSLQLIGEEVTYGADLNQDGEIGLLPAGDRVDYGLGNISVYEISSVGHGILANGARYLTPLTDVKGNAWSGNPIAVNATFSGHDLILETLGKKGTSYSEISVSSDGQVAKKGSTLTSLQLIGEEVTYGADLNQDGEIGLLPAGDRADYGSRTISIYEIAGVGHGILADGATYLTPLTDTKSNAWSSATPIGVEATSTGYNLITETVGKKGSTFSEFSVTSDGEVSKKGAKLTSLQLVVEEVGYNADLNQDGSIGLLPAGDRADYGSGATKVYEISGVGYGILADGADYLTPLTDSKGKAWSAATPIAVEATSTGYNLITETVGKKGSTFSEYTVTSDGEVSKKGAKLTSLQLVGEEVSYNADLNQDGSIGLLPSGDRADYGSNTTSVYEISGVGHGILPAGADYLTPLTDTKGNAWSSAVPIAVESTSAGYNLITETVGKKGSTFSEYSVSIDGEVSKKGAKLTSLQLVGEEVSYNADLNQDGSIGLLPAGDRADYGSNTTSVYEISGVGHGILADGSTYLTPLTDTKGNAWSVATPIAITTTDTGYTLVAEKVGKKSSTFTEYDVSESGQVAKKGTNLKEDDILTLEVTYNADLDQDGQGGNPALILGDTAADFKINDQFDLKIGFTAPGIKAFTEGSTTVAIESDPYSLLFVNAVADFNNDGLDDILMDYADTLMSPIFLTSNGDGTFSDVTTVTGDNDIRTIRNATVIDINDDGYLDVVAFAAPHGWHAAELGNLWDGDEHSIIYYNQGGNSFTGVPIAEETYNHGGDVGDLNGDGILEIFSLSERPDYTPYASSIPYRGVVLLDDNGTYVRSSHILPSVFDTMSTFDMRIGDLNDDGFDDLVIATSPLYGDGETPMSSSAIGSFKVGLSDGSLNIADYSWNTYGTHQMSEVEWNAFKATYAADELTDAYDNSGTMGGVNNIELIDINDDGQLDVVPSYFVQYDGGWIWSGFGIYINENGSFTDQTSVFAPDQSGNQSVTEVTSAIWRIFKEDINGDGAGDLIIQNQTPEQSWNFNGEKSHTIYINEEGVFYPANRSNIDVEQILQGEPNSLNQVRVGDFNGDGSADLSLMSVSHSPTMFDHMYIHTLLNTEVV